MQDTYDIQSFCTRKEDKSFDRKSARKEPKEILRHLIGFANADGGLLVVGIEDDGEITGFSYQKSHQPEDFIHALYNLQKMPIPVTYHLLDVTNNKGIVFVLRCLMIFSPGALPRPVTLENMY